MIISKDHKLVFVCPTKTGTRTTKNVLAPYSIFLEEHADYGRMLYQCSRKIDNFDPSVIEKYYVFWRDPVERFISGANHFRSPNYIKFLIKFKPNWFTGIDLSAYSDGSPETILPEIPDNVIQDCLSFAANITPEQIFEDHTLKTNNLVLRQQAFWYRHIPAEKLVILPFTNFESSLKTVAIEFGAPADIQIPRINESRKLTAIITSDLEAKVRDYYAEDYELAK
jgi:hypothetical protein